MYIGPWQEYKLSQNQISNSNLKKNNDEILRNQLLRALQVNFFNSFHYISDLNILLGIFRS
jgi:hypothetical protein